MKKILSKKQSKNFKLVITFFSFLAGFIFIDQTITGRVVLNPGITGEITSLIGLLLIICSILLAYHTVKEK